MKAIYCVLMGLFLAGCGSLSTANYPLRPLASNKTLQDSKAPVVYVRLARTTPLEALRSGGAVSAKGWEEAVAGAVGQATGAIAGEVKETEATWATIRNKNAFETIEVYGAGLTNAGDLDAVGKILAWVK